MPRTVTIEKEVYSFDELDDQAKERARDWYRGLSDEFDYEFVIDDFVTIAEIIGIEFDTHTVNLMSGKTRHDPNIWWSVSYCQGDGACFEGTYRPNGDSCAKIREHCSDEELLRITDELAAIQAAQVLAGKPTVEATIKKIDHHYTHENTVSIDVTDAEEDEDEPLINADVDRIEELMRDLMRWLHKKLIEESDYLYSAEYVDETIRANEYEFDELGRPN